jgi:hypothetical protein
MSEADFYRRLAPLRTFNEVADPSVYAPAPPSWYLIITDVRDSTKAVEAGRYKEVNVLGAASIVTVLNACDDRRLPFVFGGDGATVLVTANELDRATTALLGLAATAQAVFDMDLRVGVVPLQDVVDAGHEVRVAKLAMSDDLDLAMFWGTGMGYGEDLVKSSETEEKYTLRPGPNAEHPDVTGLQCRWRPIAARNGRMVSLMVLACADSEEERAECYREVLSAIDRLSPDPDAMRPVDTSRLELDMSQATFEREARITTGKRTGLEKAMKKTATRAKTAVGDFLMSKGKRLGTFDGANYKKTLVTHTDFRKFDDVLRMVVDLTAAQERQLRESLEERRREGQLFYGTHAADSALMTCLVFDGDRDHIHFIDGADGGYAIAAKEMKAQIRNA